MLTTKNHHLHFDFFAVKPKYNDALLQPTFVKVSYQKDVVYITPSDVKNVSSIVTADKITLYDNRTLKTFVSQYDHLVMVNKSVVVNVFMIDKIHKSLSMIWCGNLKFKTSRHYRPELLRKIEGVL